MHKKSDAPNWKKPKKNILCNAGSHAKQTDIKKIKPIDCTPTKIKILLEKKKNETYALAMVGTFDENHSQLLLVTKGFPIPQYIGTKSLFSL